MVAVAILGGAAIGAVGSVAGAGMGASAQSKAAQNAAAIQKQQYDQTREDLSPYRTAGASANTQYSDLMGVNGASARNAAFSNYQTDPSYAWQQQQAVNQVQASAAARGSLFSGGTLRGISDRTQNIANMDYGNYLQRLAGLSERGQNAAAQTGSFGANAASGAANAAYEGGAAQAAGYAGAANGINSAINNGLTAYGYYKGYQPGGSGAFSNYGGTAQSILNGA